MGTKPPSLYLYCTQLHALLFSEASSLPEGRGATSGTREARPEQHRCSQPSNMKQKCYLSQVNIQHVNGNAHLTN